jgi:hypothetical protein
MYRPCLVPHTVHVKIGGIWPQNWQYGPTGEGSTGTGICGMNCPAHQSGTIDRQELQPANSITALPERD